MKKRMLYQIPIFGLLLGGCGLFGITNDEEIIPTSSEVAFTANATMIDSKGNKLGVAKLTETTEGVKIRLELKNVPAGEKAIHIHEVGACDVPNFETSGSHFNPEGKEHGFENPKGAHAGDLPNIVPKEDGTVNVELLAKNVTLQKGMPHSLFDEDGSSLIIHEGPDDYKTNPSGNSGSRITCGVIEMK